MRFRGALLVTVRLLVFAAGVTMLMLGLVKLSDRETFLAAIHAHGLMPAWAGEAVSYIVPIMEALLGVVTLWAVTTSNRASALSALAMSAMMLAMTVYAAGLWISPPPVPVSCGCTPNAAPIESWMPITIRNGTLAASASLAARFLIRAPAAMFPRHPVCP